MMTALHLIYDALLEAKHSPVVERRGKWLSGREFLDRVFARADDLERRGLRADETTVIVVSDNTIAMEQLLACWFIGASVYFVDFRTPSARVNDWVQRLTAKLVIGIKPISGVDVHVQAAELSQKTLSQRIANDFPDKNAIFFSSSGTTGLPKLTSRTQASLAKGIVAENTARDWAANGAAVSAISVAYSASCFFWLMRLASGQPIVALDLVHRLSELDNALKRKDVSEVTLAPAQIRKLLGLVETSDQNAPLRYEHLTQFCSIGGPASEKEKYAAVTKLSAAYRMTYSAVGFGKISRLNGEEVKHKPASVGRPIDTIQVEIYEGDRLCPVNEVGEISVSNQHFNDQRPGDLGYIDEDGYLFVTGRTQGLLCRNGVNFSSEKLVEVALDLADVSNAEVVSLPDLDGGDRIYLVLETSKEMLPTIWRHMRRHLPIAEQPDQILALRSIPTTPSLKNDLPAIRLAVQNRIEQ